MRTPNIIRQFTGGRQRGAVILLVTFSLLAFFGFAALVLDLGRMYIVESELQNAADSGALRGAKELNGTGAGVAQARTEAINGALENKHLLVANAIQGANLTVEVATAPFGATWVDATTVGATEANDYYFIRVTVPTSGIHSFFAGVIGIEQNAATALAVAGRYPQGRILPMYMPILRRNYDQTSGTACDGKLFDAKDNGGAYSPSVCPNTTGKDGGAMTDIRGPDHGDALGKKTWGYLKPNENRTFPVDENSDDRESETGGYYIFKMKPSTDPDWVPTGTVWTGNFGWLVEGSTQLEIQQAVCKGTSRQVVTPPGCADVQTGGLSTPAFVDALNSRFDIPTEKQLPKDMTYALCPPDRNVHEYSGPPPSAYDQYKVNSPPAPPPIHAGARNRRVMRLYVVDNYMKDFYGYTDGTSTCLEPIGGTPNDAHVVGCVEFFMWKPADKKDDGLFYGEFIRRVPDDECIAGTGPETYNEIRLYR